VTFAVLSAFGIVPETPKADEPVAVEAEEKKLDTNPVVEVNAVPVRIVADAINLDVHVENPVSRDIATLDAALLKGAVRYPSSGALSDNNNMLVFGHSSGLPVIHNQNYKIFNNLKDLEEGDIVRVYSEKREYLYRVDTVSHVDANDALITFAEGVKKLTLSTCDSFGKKTERYVVEASFVGSYLIEA
jgi:LPXTG-site transpeptidase (sortase) family protein